MSFPSAGMNGRVSVITETVRDTLATFSQTPPRTLNAQYAAAAPRIKKKNCLMKIEYELPLSCSEVTVDAESTIVKPKPDKSTVHQMIRKYGNSCLENIFEYLLLSKWLDIYTNSLTAFWNNCPRSTYEVN